MRVKILKLYRNDKDKQGNPLKTKDGRPYTRIRMQTDQHGEALVSGFQNAQSAKWEVGQEVDVDVTQNGEYLNFSVPKAEEVKLDGLEAKIEELTTLCLRIYECVKPKIDDVPFGD